MIVFAQHRAVQEESEIADKSDLLFFWKVKMSKNIATGSKSKNYRIPTSTKTNTFLFLT